MSSPDLMPAQRAWLEAKVAAGDLKAVDDGLSDDDTGVMTIARPDLAWAQPFIDAERAKRRTGAPSAPSELAYGRRFGEAIRHLIDVRLPQPRPRIGPVQVTVVFPFLLVDTVVEGDDITNLLKTLEFGPDGASPPATRLS